MGKRSRVDRRVWSVSCQHHWHDHGAPGEVHFGCCHCGAGVEVVAEGAGLRARFFGTDEPPAELVELVEGLALPRPRLGD